MSAVTTNPNGPFLPALYLTTEKEANFQHGKNYLPPEILSNCFAFLDWGDFAKLACVQKSWSNILVDASCHSLSSRWQLTQGLLEGTFGLRANPIRAVALLKELSHVPVDEGGAPRTVNANHHRENTSADNLYFAPAMKKLAECHFSGCGIEQDAVLGLAWLRACFEFGLDTEAAYDIAMMFEYGRRGVSVDVFAAAEWFEKAAQSGHVEAMVELGLCYELGCGRQQDDQQAIDWYREAADLGHTTAKFSLGEAFEEARGVPQSDEEACLWYYRAALAGDEDSKKALRRLHDIARVVIPGVVRLLDE